MNPEENQVELSSEILTIIFVDIVGYTRTTNQLNRKLFSQLHDVFDRICISVCENYSGKVIKKIGDAFLMAFKSPTNALLCGIEMQNSFEKYNQEKKSNPIKIRVAIHTGEVILRKGDIYGDAVNTAARIEGIAGPGEIVFSEAVFLAMNKNEIPFVHLGLKRLKGLKYPIRIFRVKGHYDKIIRVRNKKKKRAQRLKKILFFIFILVLLGLIGYLAFRLNLL